MPIDLFVDFETDINDKAPLHYPKFDPMSVKMENLKDPVKRDDKLKTAMGKHFGLCREKATLYAPTCKIICMSYCISKDEIVVMIDEEENILRKFWELVGSVINSHGKIYTWNGEEFDLPIAFQRSWILGIPTHLPALRRGNWWNDVSVDLLKVWKMGRKDPSANDIKYMPKNKLDYVAQYLGYPPKIMNGKEFASMLKKEPDTAIAYARGDIERLIFVFNRTSNIINSEIEVKDIIPEAADFEVVDDTTTEESEEPNDN